MEHKNEIRDPVEFMVNEALIKSGLPFKRLHGEHADFTLDDGTEIECKRFFSERIYKQAAKYESVIVIQGLAAARSFARLVESGNVRDTCA